MFFFRLEIEDLPEDLKQKLANGEELDEDDMAVLEEHDIAQEDIDQLNQLPKEMKEEILFGADDDENEAIKEALQSKNVTFFTISNLFSVCKNILYQKKKRPPRILSTYASPKKTTNSLTQHTL